MPLAAITMNFMGGWVEGISYDPALNPDLFVTGIRVAKIRKQRVRVLVGAYRDVAVENDGG